MNILVFRTDIKTKKNVKKVKKLFITHNTITDCFVDIKDIDNVLRIETESNMKEQEIIVALESIGFQCEALNH